MNGLTVRLGALRARSRAGAETQGGGPGRRPMRGCPEGNAPIQAAETHDGARALSKPASWGRQPGHAHRDGCQKRREKAGVKAGVTRVRAGPGETQACSATDPRGHRGTVWRQLLSRPGTWWGPDTRSRRLGRRFAFDPAGSPPLRPSRTNPGSKRDPPAAGSLSCSLTAAPRRRCHSPLRGRDSEL